MVTEYVPWAAHNTRFTHAFEHAVATASRDRTIKAIAKEYRIEWKTAAAIIGRIGKELTIKDRGRHFDNLKKIGIDDTSYKKGHTYMMVIVDHERNSLIFCEPGRDAQTVSRFFETLTEKQRRLEQIISADGWKIRGAGTAYPNYLVPHPQNTWNRY